MNLPMAPLATPPERHLSAGTPSVTRVATICARIWSLVGAVNSWSIVSMLGCHIYQTGRVGVSVLKVDNCSGDGNIYLDDVVEFPRGVGFDTRVYVRDAVVPTKLLLNHTRQAPQAICVFPSIAHLP